MSWRPQPWDDIQPDWLTESVDIPVFHADVRQSQPSHLSSVRPAVPRAGQVSGYFHQQVNCQFQYFQSSLVKINVCQMFPWQKLLKSAIIFLVIDNKMLLQPDTNWWPGGHSRRSLRSESAQVRSEVSQVQGAAVRWAGELCPLTVRCYTDYTDRSQCLPII